MKSQAGDNVKGSKFKIDGHVRISKYKHVFGKGYTSNWSQRTYVISDFS